LLFQNFFQTTTETFAARGKFMLIRLALGLGFQLSFKNRSCEAYPTFFLHNGANTFSRF